LNSRALPNVLSRLKHRITNAVAEGLESMIATAQQCACGYRDVDDLMIAIYLHRGGLNPYPIP
jgi:hypothetical protein